MKTVVAGAELYGPHTYMPGLRGNGTWISLAQRTIDEVYDYWTPDCGGGIYWVCTQLLSHGSSTHQYIHQSTDPAQYATYKSGITQLEFISLATRAYLLTKNGTLLQITERLFTWIVDSGMVDLATGTVFDGVDTVGCTVSKAQWSYSYGVSRVIYVYGIDYAYSEIQHLVGGLSYLYRATGNSSYLTYASKIATTAINIFAPDGVAEELCEVTGSCNQDQQGFKVTHPVLRPHSSGTLHSRSTGYLSSPTFLPVSHHARSRAQIQHLDRTAKVRGSSTGYL